MEAFRQAVAAGADAIEFDVRLTRDGRVVVMHDPTVDRTTSGSGAVADLTLAQIRSLDAGVRFTSVDGTASSYAGRGITAPTLEDVLDAFPTLPCIIEIKTPTVSAEVRRLVIDRGAADRCVVGSFVDDALDLFRGSGIAVGASTAEMKALYWRAFWRLPVPRVSFQLVSAPTEYGHIPLPIAGYVRILKPLGVPVHVWTVDDPQAALELWAKGVQGILTNDPVTMLRAAGR